jgi:hypothetical protein
MRRVDDASHARLAAEVSRCGSGLSRVNQRTVVDTRVSDFTCLKNICSRSFERVAKAASPYHENMFVSLHLSTEQAQTVTTSSIQVFAITLL